MVYEKLFKFYDKWATKVLSEFINYKTKYLNMQDVYEKIIKVLINYQKEWSKINLEEDEDNDYVISKTLSIKTSNILFDIMTIPKNNKEVIYVYVSTF